MNTVSFSIKILLPHLGFAEQKVANFILENPKALIPLSITELAKTCETSEATVTRFSKKLGYDGFQQMKLAIAQESGIRPVRNDISSIESPIDIFVKMCDDIYYSLEKTTKAINPDSLQKACEALLGAEKILIFGLGNSAAIALDAEHKFLRLGLNAKSYTDNHMQMIAASHTNNSCVAIAISHSGSSKDVVQALKECKDNGAITISLTNHGKSPIYRASTYVLNTVSNETSYTILGLNSRIAQLAIIDTLYSYLVLHLSGAQSQIKKSDA